MEDQIYTGERFLPDDASSEMRIEHIQRYMLAQQLVTGKDVLDIACGEGYGSHLLSKMARTVTGVDIDTNAVEHANAKYHADNLRYAVGNIMALPVEDHTLDIIVSFETIEHVHEEEQWAFIKEARRALRDDGVLLISTPNRRIYTDKVNGYNPYHIREFYYEEFDAFLRSEFQNIHYYKQYPLMLYHLDDADKPLSVQIDPTSLQDCRYFVAACSNSNSPALPYWNATQDCEFYYELNRVVHHYEGALEQEHSAAVAFQEHQLADIKVLQAEVRNLRQRLIDIMQLLDAAKRIGESETT